MYSCSHVQIVVHTCIHLYACTQVHTGMPTRMPALADSTLALFASTAEHGPPASSKVLLEHTFPEPVPPREGFL